MRHVNCIVTPGETLVPLLVALMLTPSTVVISENIHSKKFKMNEEVESFLSEKVSNLLLT